MPTAQTLPPRLALSAQDRRQSPDETALLRRLDELYDEGKEVREKYAPEKETERDLRLYRGEVGPKDREAYFEANFIEAFIDRMVAQLTDNRPIIRIEHRKAGLRQVAEVTQKVAGSVWDEEKVQRQSFKMAHSAAVERCAGLYTGFDPVTDRLVLEVLQKDQVVIDPAVMEAALIGQAEYIFIDREKPVEELKYRFPGRGASVKPDTTSSDASEQRKGRRVLSALFDALRNKAGSADALGRASVRLRFCLCLGHNAMRN